MRPCFQQSYSCPIDGCSESYTELSNGCTYNKHSEFDPECARLNPYRPEGWDAKIRCPRHAGEDSWKQPPLRRGPADGSMMSSTDLLPDVERSCQFNRAAEQERLRGLNEAPDSGALPEQQCTGIDLFNNQRLAEGSSVTNVSLTTRRCVVARPC